MKKTNYLKRALFAAFAFTFCMLSFQIAQATHIAGANLTYQHISGNTYKVSLSLYRDCSGSQMQPSYNVQIASATCAQNLSVNVTQEAGTGQEITLPCASGGTTCASPNNTSSGFQKYTYSGTVLLPMNCADWVFSFSLCCRNCNAITTIVHGNCAQQTDPQSGIYIEAELNNLDVASNNSPTFSNNPVATLCLGQNVQYNHGVVDPDGDVLVYSIIGSQVALGTTVTYQPGYSALNPISSSPAISINSATGDIDITPQLIETGVMAIKIDEYRGGIWIGSVERDMQFIVQTCNNTLPTATGINGTADFDTTICPGTQLCFYIFSNDNDANQFVTLTTNNAIPNSAFNNSGGSHPTASFCWTPTAADARTTPWTFIVNVKDDACPTNGTQTYSFSVTVPLISPSTVATDATGDIDLTVAGNSGPYSYAWSTGATTEDVTGLAPGIYSVTICDANGCCVNTQDTINIPVNCTFATGTQHGNASCAGACDGWIRLIPHGTAPYSYQWSNGATTKDVNNLCAGTYIYTVTDANGCTHSCTYHITSPSSLMIQCMSSNTCNGASMGSAMAMVTGGTAPYQYLWDNGEVTSSISGICAGSFCVTVTDANGCSNSCCATVTSFQAITYTSTTTNASNANSCNGKLCVNAAGGTGPYSFNWSTGAMASGVTSDMITGLCPGTYTVTITDANGCSRKVTKVVGPIVLRGGNDVATNSAAAVRIGNDGDITLKAVAIPNPFNNDFTIETGSTEAVQVYIYNMSGALVKSYEALQHGQRIGAELSSGLYIMQIQQNGEVAYQRIAKQDQ